MKRRVAVTGIGLVTPVGVGNDATWQAVCEGLGIGVGLRQVAERNADLVRVLGRKTPHPVGLLAQGYGLYETMSGKGNAGGHALALGNGVFGSWLASVAVNAGKTLAEKRGQPQAPQPQPTAIPQPTTMQGQGVPMLPEPFMAGPVREVLLTPEPVPVHASVQGHDDDFEGRPARPHRRRRRRPNRFVRSGDDD